MIITIYIDDFLIYTVEIKEINNINNALKAKFHISNLELVFFFFEIAITQDQVNKNFYLC